MTVVPEHTDPAPFVAGDAASLFAGPGEVRARCRAVDWAATPLGPVARWPEALRTAVRLTLDSAFGMCLYVGPEFVLLYNEGFVRALSAGKHPTALGRPARDVFPEVQEPLEADLARVLAGGAPVHAVDATFTLERDGRLQPSSWTYAFSPVRDGDGRVLAVQSVITETTEGVRARQEAERLLAQARAARDAAETARARLERLQALTAALGAARTVPEVARVVANEGRRVFGAQGAGVALLEDEGRAFRYAAVEGVPPEILAAWTTFPNDGTTPYGHVVASGQPILFATHEEIAARFPLVREATARQGIAGMAVFPLVGSHGDPLGAAHIAFNAPGALDGAASDVVDVAGVAALAQQCAQALERALLFGAEQAAREAAEQARGVAEQASRAKSEFLAIMSHELRTPLNAIGGYAELLEMGIRGPVTPEQRADLARIQGSQRHLLGLINEVLNYAKLETGTVRYDVATVSVRGVVLDAVALITPQAQAKRLTVSVEDCPLDVAVRADAEKVRQVIVNLLSNAVKFTDAGGQVALACTADAEVVRLGVRDTGIGIAPEQHERIFEPFVQVRADLTRTAEGTGLGLAISRDLARGMGGDLTVASVPGEGSTFTLVLSRA